MITILLLNSPAKKGEPVYITRNGEGDLVVMNGEPMVSLDEAEKRLRAKINGKI